MGNVSSTVRAKLTNLFHSLWGRKKASLVILGLDNAGKSTLVNLLQGVTTQPIPTIGFNIEEVQLNNTTITICDIGGQSTFRNFWNKYVSTMDGLVFVIDICDKERFETSYQAFQKMFSELRNGISVLLLLNKIDKLENADEIKEARERIERLYKVSTERSIANPVIIADDHGLVKEFHTRIYTISVLDDIEKIKNDSSFSIAKSSVYQGFSWLIDNIGKENK